MKVKELVKLLEELAPLSYAAPWDNPGLVLGDPEGEVKHIYIGFDTDLKTVEAAVRSGADFLLTHHPLLFKPVSNLCLDTLAGKKLSLLLSRGLAVYGMHTSFDAAPGCMGDLAAERLGLTNTEPLDAEGFGLVGDLEEPGTPAELAKRVKEAFGLPFVKLWSREETPVSRVAVLPGSGAAEWQEARKKGAGLYICGDMTHHHALDALDMGLSVVDGGHYGTEWYFLDKLESYLTEKLAGENVRITKEAKSLPERIL